MAEGVYRELERLRASVGRRLRACDDLDLVITETLDAIAAAEALLSRPVLRAIGGKAPSLAVG